MPSHRTATALALLAILSSAPGLSFAQPYDQPYDRPAAQGGGNPLSSVFGCDAAGGKQAGGAVIGGLLGGLLGNSVSGRNRGLGTVLGAAGGAALGSYVGCRLQRGDAQRAEAAARQALESPGQQTWSNPETGASGSVVSTPISGGAGPDLNGLRLAPGVELASGYESAPTSYQAASNLNLRAGPSKAARVVGKLRDGEVVNVIGRVSGSAWVLVARNGIGAGYASEASLRPLTTAAPAGPQCRAVEQTIRTADGQAQVQHYTACRNASGDWVIHA
jgi:surface antigen